MMELEIILKERWFKSTNLILTVNVEEHKSHLIGDQRRAVRNSSRAPRAAVDVAASGYDLRGIQRRSQKHDLLHY